MRYEDAAERRPRSRPGQFAQILAHPSQRLIRRPMSIHDEGDGWRSFMVKPVGPATRELVALHGGDSIDASPPLGCGFPHANELGDGPVLLVGGGFGIAPLHFMARHLDRLPSSPGYRILYGGRTRREVELDVLEGIRGALLPSTDDGSLGFHGTCVDLCREELRRVDAASTTVLTCGPHPMMQALVAAVRESVQEIYVSLEERMACGVGVCMGCVTPTRGGYVPICTHGPVFRASEVFGVDSQVGHV
ncbi:MAG: dihydroorotate dehydrogenase electron transfer subunit [Candidatus Krumholzibacteriia bacterium]